MLEESVLDETPRLLWFRAIEFYRDSGGIRMSDALKKQHAESGFSYRGSFRFHRCCLLWLTCNKEGSILCTRWSIYCLICTELGRRINDRVTSMLDRGLIPELAQFHDEYNRTLRESEESFDYTRGIFQAIGFKEFHDYLLLSEDERTSERGKTIFNEGRWVRNEHHFPYSQDWRWHILAVERLKVSTRQYSKYQEKWLRMRLLQRKWRLPSIFINHFFA